MKRRAKMGQMKRSMTEQVAERKLRPMGPAGEDRHNPYPGMPYDNMLYTLREMREVVKNPIIGVKTEEGRKVEGFVKDEIEEYAKIFERELGRLRGEVLAFCTVLRSTGVLAESPMAGAALETLEHEFWLDGGKPQKKKEEASDEGNG